MQEYYVIWMDSYNLANWGSEEKVRECYPITEVELCNDGWIDCCHKQEFTLEEGEDLKEKVRQVIDNVGRIIEVFSVFKKGENEKAILTEEDC